MKSGEQNTSKPLGSSASKFGQLIGEAFERAVFQHIHTHLRHHHPEYEILLPAEGKKLVTLQTLGGTFRQLDTVIVAKESDDPVALLETKWLKDARHHNDKGAWILQLREVRKQYSTVRGAIAILAGYWTEGVGVMLNSNAGVKMVLAATDIEVYSTLQKPLDDYLGDNAFLLDPVVMRQSYPRPSELVEFLTLLYKSGDLQKLAQSWLHFPRRTDMNGNIITGGDLIRLAIDDLLAPLPEKPRIERFEISLQINTGNTIYGEFEDVEALIDFIQSHFQNPDEILRKISPRKRK